jgi:hypothetical protein
MSKGWAAFRKWPTWAQGLVWVIVGLIVISIIGAAAGGSSSKSSAATTTQAGIPTSTVAAPVQQTQTKTATHVSAPAASDSQLQAYIGGLKQKLSSCNAGLLVTQLALAKVLSSGSSQSDYIDLYSAAKQAAPLCQYSDLTFGNYNPPAGYPSLAGAAYGGFGFQVHNWAQDDNGKVLDDVQTVANDPTGTAGIASLISDTQQADADAQVIENQLKAAAIRGHLREYTGLDLAIWGVHQK